MDNITQKTYYLARRPGSSFYPDKMILFTDAKYLNTLYSNENIEIILEMCSFIHGAKTPGLIPQIIHKLYSYDLLQGEMKQISTQAIRFPFNVNECTEFVVVNHTLITTCLDGIERKTILTSLIDLTQKSIDTISNLNILPKVSAAKVIKTYKNSFLQYSNTMVNEFNVKGLDSTILFMYGQSVDSNLQNDCITNIRTNIDFVQKNEWTSITDSAIGACILKTYTEQDRTDKNKNNTYKDLYTLETTTIFTGSRKKIEPTRNLILLVLSLFQVLKEKGRYLRNIQDLSHDFYFKIDASPTVSQVALNNASITNLVFNSNDTIAENIDSINLRFSLVHFPSYHSYLFSYNRLNQQGNVSFIKLGNPFSEIENHHWDNRPVCLKWACVLISTFEAKQNFVRIYDMRNEELFSKEYEEIFAKTYPDLDTGNNDIDLDLIPDNYTVRPIQILNTSNLQLVQFEETSSTTDSLTLVMFFFDNKIEYYNLSREARLTSSSIYFMSSWVDITVRTIYSRQIKHRLTFLPYLASDFYKYIVQVGIFVGLGATLLFFYFKYLRREQSLVEIEDKKSAAFELVEREYILEETKRQMYEHEGGSSEFQNSDLRRKTIKIKKKEKDNSMRSVFPFELKDRIFQEPSVRAE